MTTSSKVGWWLLIGGGALQLAEGVGQADATLNNLQFSDTAIGKVVDPFEKFLPIPLGWTLVIIGATLIWVIPRIL